MHQATTDEAAPLAGRAADPGSATVETRMTFASTPAVLWERLMFYEQIEERPPLHLRMLLPVPIRTEGRKSEVGDEALCLYQGGSLVKRVTHVEKGSEYRFSVVKQSLEVGGGMRLSGGSYTLRAVDPSHTEIVAITHYVSPRRPRWLWGPVEQSVCHAFHRHILRAMGRGL